MCREREVTHLFTNRSRPIRLLRFFYDCAGGTLNRLEKLQQSEEEQDRPGSWWCRWRGTLDGTVEWMIQTFKSMTTNAYINGVKKHNWPPFPGKLWQRNYDERIIRNDHELNHIRQYINNNPGAWAVGNENPAHYRRV